MANIKYCKSEKSNIWYVFGFKFNSIHIFKNCIVCYDKVKIWKKRNNMILIEADEAFKDMLFSNDKKSVMLATTTLNQIAKKEKVLLKYKT